MVDESVTHLFICFPFTRSLWYQLMIHLNIQGSWMGGSLEEVVDDRVDRFGKNLLTIPVRVLWGIWIHQNKALF